MDEGAFSSSESANKQEYAITLKRDEDVKYNATISIEVLNQGLDESIAWYDSYFAQAPSNPVTKVTGELKGRRSFQYTLKTSSTETRLYLFSVAEKTYVFTSVNEGLNVQDDSGYWDKFGKVFESIKISYPSV